MATPKRYNRLFPSYSLKELDLYSTAKHLKRYFFGKSFQFTQFYPLYVVVFYIAKK